MKNILLTITGPSLTGKTELAKLLNPHGFEELVSTTTRPRREGEIAGVNYNYVSFEEFDDMTKKNLMIQKNPVGNNMYGLSKTAFDKVISNGNSGIVVVAPEGAKQIADYCNRNNIIHHQIFINNDLETLISRFLNRYKNDKLADDKTYTIRLKDMMTVEQEIWVKQAYNGTDYYDQIFENFGPETENNIIERIKISVDAKVNKSSVKKLKNR